MMKKNLLIILLLTAQFSLASPLSDGALRLIQIGSEIGSRDIVMRGQSLLLKGAFDLYDLMPCMSLLNRCDTAAH